MKLKPSDEQIKFLEAHGKPVPAERWQASRMMTRIVEEERRKRGTAMLRKEGGALFQEDVSRDVGSAFLRELDVREGTVLRDDGGPFVVAKVLSERTIKIFRHGNVPTSIDIVVQDEQRGWIVRSDIRFEANPPSGMTFNRCVTVSSDAEASRKLQRFIQKHIEPRYVRNTPYGLYWDTAAVEVIRQQFEGQSSLSRSTGV